MLKILNGVMRRKIKKQWAQIPMLISFITSLLNWILKFFNKSIKLTVATEQGICITSNLTINRETTTGLQYI